MDEELSYIEDLLTLLKEHKQKGGKLAPEGVEQLKKVRADLERVRDEAVKEMLLAGDTVGTIVDRLLVTPARIREIAKKV